MLNREFIKTKRNKKLKSKFFQLSEVLYIVKKQVYKLKLSIKLKMYDVFHISLLEQNTKKRGQVDQLLEPKKFETKDNKEYKVLVIIDNMVYS